MSAPALPPRGSVDPNHPSARATNKPLPAMPSDNTNKRLHAMPAMPDDTYEDPGDNPDQGGGPVEDVYEPGIDSEGEMDSDYTLPTDMTGPTEAYEVINDGGDYPEVYEEPDDAASNCSGGSRGMNRGPLPEIPALTKHLGGIKIMAGPNTIQQTKQKLRKTTSTDHFQPPPKQNPDLKRFNSYDPEANRAPEPMPRYPTRNNSTGSSSRSNRSTMSDEGQLGWSASGPRGSISESSDFDSGTGTFRPPGTIAEEPHRRKSTSSGPTCHIAGESWYFGSITREQASERLCQDPQNGVFLVRESSKKGDTPYAMSIWYENKTYNLTIRKLAGNKYALGSEKVGEALFGSIQELVQYHMHTELTLASLGMVKGSCCLKRPPPINFHY